MDDFGHPADGSGDELGLVGIVSYVVALFLCLATSLISLSNLAESGPDVGEIVSFDPAMGPKRWDQAGIPAQRANRSETAPGSHCILMPSVMSAGGGSLVIEAKEMTRPPLFRVHWSGKHTDLGARDCGRSADLVLPLVHLRALANIAGGFGLARGLRIRLVD